MIIQVIGAIAAIIVSILVILVIAVYINHTLKSIKESRKYIPRGDMIRISNKKVNVVIEGTGDETLVFLAGHGTFSPVYDFKPLWMRMTDDHKCVIIERPGYGVSDASNDPRDIDTMLSETKKALKLLSISPPYTLVAHSMAGLEALYWASRYPDEVKSIIGIDPCTPDVVDKILRYDMKKLKLMYYISRIGFSRFIPDPETGKYMPLIDSNELTQDDKDRYKAAFYKSSYTKNMLNELRCLKNNANTVRAQKIPVDIPVYFYISEQQDKAVPGWIDTLVKYLSNISGSEYMILDAGHYLHHEVPDEIAYKAFMKPD